MTSTTPPGSMSPAHAAQRDEHIRERQRRPPTNPVSIATRVPTVHLLRWRNSSSEMPRAAEQVIGDDVGADLLRRARLHEEVAEISALALLRRLLVEERVQLRRDAPLEHERKRRREQARTTRAQWRLASSPPSARWSPGCPTGRGPTRSDRPDARTRHAWRARGDRASRNCRSAQIELRRLGQQPPLGLELDTPHEQVAP
jgi:hypothetical protein